MSTRYNLIELLADGRFQSGESLGRQLGISRAAVWKHLRALAELGLDVHAVQGQGYRLAIPFKPLHADSICLPLSGPVRSRIECVEVFKEIDSTSDYLKRLQPRYKEGHGRACVAEWQTSGRGRRGRRWVSPYGSNLYLSLAMRLGEGVLRSGGLSLVAAIAVLRALQCCGVDNLGLKWPNDIFYHGRKLAGILLDLSGESGGPYHVVIGVGVNLRMPECAALEIDQPWADLSRFGTAMDRNHLAGLVLEKLVTVIDTFNDKGLEVFLQEWNRFDLVAGRSVELHQDDKIMTTGIARGVDAHGGLLIDSDGIASVYHSGEVSVRLA